MKYPVSRECRNKIRHSRDSERQVQREIFASSDSKIARGDCFVDQESEILWEKYLRVRYLKNNFPL